MVAILFDFNHGVVNGKVVVWDDYYILLEIYYDMIVAIFTLRNEVRNFTKINDAVISISIDRKAKRMHNVF